MNKLDFGGSKNQKKTEKRNESAQILDSGALDQNKTKGKENVGFSNCWGSDNEKEQKKRKKNGTKSVKSWSPGHQMIPKRCGRPARIFSQNLGLKKPNKNRKQIKMFSGIFPVFPVDLAKNQWIPRQTAGSQTSFLAQSSDWWIWLGAKKRMPQGRSESNWQGIV